MRLHGILKTKVLLIVVIIVIMLIVTGCEFFEDMFFDEPPTAVISISKKYFMPGTNVKLNGEKSYVPWGSPKLSYAWELVSIPLGSTVTQGSLSGNTSSEVTFTPDIVGDYVLKLTASHNDREGETNITLHVINPPSTPSTPTVTVPENPQGATTLSISWQSVPSATSYSLKRDGIQVYSGPNLYYTDSNLSQNTSYTYVVTASNQVGSSNDSTQISGTTLLLPPDTPTSWDFIERTVNSLTLDWNDIPHATSYKVYRDTVADGTFSNKIYEGGSSQYTDTPLNESTTYYYKICASNSAGDGNPTSTISGRTRFQPLEAPQNIRITNATINSVSFSWNTVSGASGYSIEQSASEDGPWSSIATVDVGSYTRTGLSAGTNEYIRVIAFDAQNSDRDSNPSILNIYTIPNAPSNVQVEAGNNPTTSLNISWNSVTGATKYLVYRSESRYGPWGYPIKETLSSHYEDSELTPNTTYYYKATAWNPGGESTDSNIDSYKTAKAYATINVISNNNDYGSTSGSGNYEVGAAVTIRAIPKQGYKFVCWNNNNSDTGTTKNISVPLEGATYTAHFEADTARLDLYVSPSDGGSVIGSGTYNVGSTVQISAIPNSEYNFSHWSDGSTSNSRSVPILSDGSSYTAYFVKKTGRIILTASPSFGGSVSGSGTFDVGIYKTISASANSGYEFDRWSDGNDDRSRKILVTNEDIYLIAYFTELPTYSINIVNDTSSITNSDTLIIKWEKISGSDSHDINLELWNRTQRLKTIKSGIDPIGTYAYTIPNDVGGSVFDLCRVRLIDQTYGIAKYSSQFAIYNVLDGENTTNLGSLSYGESISGTTKWIDYKQPAEHYTFTTPDNPSWFATKDRITFDVWFFTSYDGGAAFELNIYDGNTLVDSTYSYVTNEKKSLDLKLDENKQYTMRIRFRSGKPIRLRYEIKHLD